MSRSSVEITSPCQRWFKWGGSNGELSYYDKEKKENILVPLPFMFLHLDTLSTIKGYSESDGEGIYANEVRNLKSEPLVVKIGKQEFTRGIYADVKDKAKGKGGKFCQSVYVAYKDESGKLVVGNISFMGSSLSGGEHKIGTGKDAKIEVIDGWMGFSKQRDALKTKAVVMEREERVCSKGATKFYAPKFSFKDVSAETDNQALALDKELQTYISHYLSKKPEQQSEAQAEVSKGDAGMSVYEPTSRGSEPSYTKVTSLIPDDDFSDLPF